MTYISIADVRRASGVPDDYISDAQVTSTIAIVEAAAERYLNTKFIPTSRIDMLDGSGNAFIFTNKNPLLAVRSLETNDTDISLDEIFVYKSSGKIMLNSGAETASFIAKAQNTIIKYVYGMVEESSTSTTSTAATTAGSSVSISVNSITGFSDEDWCEIYSTDGIEAFQISGSPSASTIVADQLVLSHESGSTVVLLQIPYFIKRLMEVEAGIACAVNVVGATYSFNTSYNLGELAVTKGEPYPQWSKVIMELIKEREFIMSKVRPRPIILVT